MFLDSFPMTFLLRLLDIVHADQKLYLVFEFIDVDLKRYMEVSNQNGTPMTLEMVKVRCAPFVASPRSSHVTNFADLARSEIHKSALCGSAVLPCASYSSSGFEASKSSHRQDQQPQAR